MEDSTREKAILTESDKARMEMKRQKALLIRQDKINKQNVFSIKEKNETRKIIKQNDSTLIDTGGGFFIEEKEDITRENPSDVVPGTIVKDPAPLFIDDQPFCDECLQPFDSSYLSKHFDQSVCDQCRDEEDKHALITKTDAKNNYLLKDVDFDIREPALKFIVRKNPHNSRWGDMKLYLKLQVEKRALEVWKTEEAIEEALQKLAEKRENLKEKKYTKTMKELRMNVRSSLYTRAVKNHEHEYGEEVYHADDDEYSKTCSTCGHSFKYDKM